MYKANQKHQSKWLYVHTYVHYYKTGYEIGENNFMHVVKSCIKFLKYYYIRT